MSWLLKKIVAKICTECLILSYFNLGILFPLDTVIQ